jgi:trehalose-6-phosphate synthase
MPLDERVERQRALLARVQTQTAAAWADAFLGDLEDENGGSAFRPRLGALTRFVPSDVAQASEG